MDEPIYLFLGTYQQAVLWSREVSPNDGRFFDRNVVLYTSPEKLRGLRRRIVPVTCLWGGDGINWRAEREALECAIMSNSANGYETKGEYI